MTEAKPETVLHQDEHATITDRRIVMFGTTYALNNVTSVSMRRIEGNRTPGIIIGFMLAAIAGCTGSASDWPAGLSIGLIIAALVFGAILATQARDKYAVRIGTAGGESDAMSSTDKSYIETLVKAINEAMVRRT